MDFRRATQADVGGLVGLQRAYYREDGYAHDEAAVSLAWATLLADSSLGLVWAIESEAELVGYLVVTFGYSLEYLGRDAFIDELYVLDGYRGQGVGRRALEIAESAVVEAGARALHLEVEHSKSAAASLYRRSGFVDHRRVLMTKWLGRP
jgi:ribosomal protein S18 acetylase RimI-like enzyme